MKKNSPPISFSQFKFFWGKMLLLYCLWLCAAPAPLPAQVSSVGGTPFGNAEITLEPVWKYATGGRVTALTESFGPRRRIYVLSEDRRLYGLDRGGSLMWRSDRMTGRPRPLLKQGPDGSLYLGFEQGHLAAYNPSGRRLWTRRPSKSAAEGIVLGHAGLVYAFNEETLTLYTHTGTLLWRDELPSPGISKPVVDEEGGVWTVSADNELLRISSSGVETLARLQNDENEPIGSVRMLMSAAGPFIVAAQGKKMWLYDSAGTLLWDSDLYSQVESMCMDTETIFVRTADRRIAAIERGSGAELWNTPIDMDSAEIVTEHAGTAPHSRLLTAYNEQRIKLYLTAEGSVLSTGRIPQPSAGPLVSADGDIIIGAKDWVVYRYAVRGYKDPEISTGLVEKTPGEQLNTQSKEQISGQLKYGRSSANNGPYSEAGQVILEEAAHKEYLLLLDELARRAEKSKPEKDYPEMIALLKKAAGVGVLNPVRREGAYINDYPDIRSRAVELLGTYGTLTTQSFLLELLQYEWDTQVKLKILTALGALQSGLDGRVIGTLKNVIESGKIDIDDDPLITSRLISTIQKICLYSGRVDTSAVKILTDIYLSDAPRTLRMKAIETLRNLSG